MITYSVIWSPIKA